MSDSLTFLKLGGSLITDKSRPGTLRPEAIDIACEEIRKYLAAGRGRRLLLGHGSGSFGHVPAEKHGTREGVTSPEAWRGFAEVWQRAAELNSILTQRLEKAGISLICFPPSASVATRNREIAHWELSLIERAFQAGLVALVYGDVVFDTQIGGTILSTEELFVHLAGRLVPDRILLAGVEEGVWRDFPSRTDLVGQIHPEEVGLLFPFMGKAEGHDVTGGMVEKVEKMAALVRQIPSLEVLIFSGLSRENMRQALEGGAIGTRIAYPPGQQASRP